MGKLTFKVKLLTIFILLAATSVFLFSTVAVSILKTAIQKEVAQTLESNSRLTISRINAWKTKNEGDMLRISDPYSTVSTSLVEFLGQQSADKKEKVRMNMERAIFNSANFLHLFILDDKSERILISTSPSSEGKSATEEMDPAYLSSDLPSSPIYYSSHLKTFTLDLKVPIKNNSGEIIAFLGGHVNLQALSALLADPSMLGKSDETFLVTPEGKSVIGIWKSFSQLPSDDYGPQLDRKTFEPTLSGKSSTREYLNYGQKLVMGFQEYLPNLQVIFFHERESSEVFAPLKQLTQKVWLVALFIFGLFTVLAFLFIFWFTKPIGSLIRTARKIADGDYHMRAKIKSRDEIGALGNAFNQMTDVLVNSLTDLSVKNALLQSEYDSAMYGILSVDPKGEILSWNKRFVDLWEVSPNLLEKNAFSELILFCSKRVKQPDDFVKRTSKIIKIKEKTSHDTIEMTNGKIIDQQSTTLIDRDGKVLGKVFFLRDVTREAEVNKTKNEFVSLASHQLQTPLTAMNWLLESLLEKEKNDKNKYDMVKDAYNSTLRMICLVNDLLNVSHLDAGLISVDSKKTELVHFLRELVAKAQIVATTKKIEIHFEEPKEKLLISMDRILFENIFMNLLSNAIRFSDQGKKITIKVKKVRNAAEISIADQGIGISKADQRLLFNKFFRTDAAARYNTTGSGLGMYITKKLLALCKGDLKVRSQVNKGSVFSFSLPLKGPVIKKEGAKSLIQQAIKKF
jgi:signal transduction histidine kinase